MVRDVLEQCFGRIAQVNVPIYLVEDAVALLSIPVTKLISTIYMTMRRPLRAIQAVPINFAKNVLAIDLAFSSQFNLFRVSRKHVTAATRRLTI
jgi:hypothetical protein